MRPKKEDGVPVKVEAACFLILAVLSSGCTTRRTVSEHFIFKPPETGDKCYMTWAAGDHWGFLAWAVLDDPSAAPILAMAAGYRADSLPPPGTRVGLPLHRDMEPALENRLSAARIVRDATALRDREENGVLDLLMEAVEIDPDWSVPRTNVALLHIEAGDVHAARNILGPVSRKYTPALLLSKLDWEGGQTESALSHIAEAMTDPDPPPETLAAAGVIYTVLGEFYLASLAWRKLLENPDAPSHLRLLAMEMLLK